MTADLLGPDTSAALGDLFDAVLLDAPCTGLGTLRRHPEQRWRIQEEDIARLAVVQADLLEGGRSACPAWRACGVLYPAAWPAPRTTTSWLRS